MKGRPYNGIDIFNRTWKPTYFLNDIIIGLLWKGIGQLNIIIHSPHPPTHSLGRPRSDSHNGSPDTSVLHGSFKFLRCHAHVFDQDVHEGCWRPCRFLVSIFGCAWNKVRCYFLLTSETMPSKSNSCLFSFCDRSRSSPYWFWFVILSFQLMLKAAPIILV